MAPPFVHTYNPSSRHGIDSLSIEREAVYYTLSWVVLLYYSEALSRIMFALTGIDRAFHSNRFDPDRGQPVIWVQHQSVGISDPQKMRTDGYHRGSHAVPCIAGARYGMGWRERITDTMSPGGPARNIILTAIRILLFHQTVVSC